MTATPATDLEALRSALTAAVPAHLERLADLVRIPSVSADPGRAGEVRRSAEAVRDLLAAAGLRDTRLLEIDGAPPAVYGDWLDAGPDAPTLLLYAHHDVQPTGPVERWTTPPFEPSVRDGRLFGRGAAHDKAGVLVHVAAVQAWLETHGRLPVNVKVFIEGEEEVGSEHLGAFLDAYRDLLRSDVMVLTDSTNWQVGVPALTTSLRGLVDCVVEVRALDHAIHSGMYGGPVPDPVTGLIRLLATLTDERGAVAVPDLLAGIPAPSEQERKALAGLDFDEERFRAEAGVLPGVELVGDPEHHPLERIWWQPSITIIGFDAPRVAEASNTLVPSAQAKVSLRLAPGQDPAAAAAALRTWLEEHAPWGLQTTVTPGAAGSSFRADVEHPAMQAAARALEQAYGHPVVFTGVGGSIPFIEPFAEAFGGAPALLTGVEDPDTRAHGIDESLHLADFTHACLGEAYLFAEIAALPPA